jgi:hypothetical protein
MVASHGEAEREPHNDGCRSACTSGSHPLSHAANVSPRASPLRPTPSRADVSAVRGPRRAACTQALDGLVTTTKGQAHFPDRRAVTMRALSRTCAGGRAVVEQGKAGPGGQAPSMGATRMNGTGCRGCGDA